jgi:hypothetical protein
LRASPRWSLDEEILELPGIVSIQVFVEQLRAPLERVPVGVHVANKVQDFLLEVQSDNTKLGKIGTEQQRLIDQYSLESLNFDLVMDWVNWTQNKLNAEAPSEMGQLDIAADNLEQGTAMLADAGATYAKEVEAKAQAYLDAWDQTERNQSKKETFEVINALVDVATAFPGGRQCAQRHQPAPGRREPRASHKAIHLCGSSTPSSMIGAGSGQWPAGAERVTMDHDISVRGTAAAKRQERSGPPDSRRCAAPFIRPVHSSPAWDRTMPQRK